jgi:capsid protein
VNYYKENPPTLNGVRIPVLGLNDEIIINSSPRQTTAFPAFQAAFLQSIAAGLGISYEQLAMDWSKVNYSSARAALNEVWRHIQLMFAVFSEQIVAPIYYAVMEEAFDRGYILLPAGRAGLLGRRPPPISARASSGPAAVMSIPPRKPKAPRCAWIR